MELLESFVVCYFLKGSGQLFTQVFDQTCRSIIAYSIFHTYDTRIPTISVRKTWSQSIE